jgi:hypothetical protein
MPLCAKCHQNEATIHFTIIVGAEEEKIVHLCKDCAPPPGLHILDPRELEALSVIGKKCEFCGKDAFSGEMGAKGGANYWCFDCGLEIGRILTDSLFTERPDLMQWGRQVTSFLSVCWDTGLQVRSEAAKGKAMRILRERRRQAGRDKGS